MKPYSIFLFFIITTSEIISQSNFSWTKKNNFIAGKRERAVAFSIGDYGYIATGVDTAEMAQNDLWKYNPVDDSWTQLANMPGSPRRDAVGFSINGVGYVGLGIDNDLATVGNKKNDFWKYDPIFNQWDSIAPFPGGDGNGIYAATAFTADGKGFICGGKIGPGIYSKQLWEYKPSNNQWIQRADFPGGVRYQLCSFSINNIGYVGMGINQDVYKKDFYKYDPGSNEWSTIAPFPAVERGGASTFVINNKGYVCLGTNGGLLGDLLEYDPEQDTWCLRQSYGGSERKNAVSFTINNTAYVGLGKGYSGKKSSMYEYGLSSLALINYTYLDTVKIFPNPTNGLFYINFKKNEPLEIQLLDLKGNIIITALAQSNLPIDISMLPKGVYFLKEKDKFSTEVIKLILN